MKKYILVATAVILVSSAFSQSVLTFRDNAFNMGDVLISKDIQYVDPGNAGPDQIWDFSKIKITGTESNSNFSPIEKGKRAGLSEYNVLLKDNVREYYMFLTSSGLTEKGYTNKDLTLIYSAPVRKMVYPFSYGESFTDKYAGSATYAGNSKIEISGDNTVTADAYGSLILPDRSLSNTLRVKAEKRGLEVGPCNSSLVHTLKYSWFAPGYRYPVLVISITEIITNGKEPVITKSAAINVQKAVTAETITGITNAQSEPANDNAVSVFPNPFNENFNFHYFLNKQMPVRIVLYDVTGKLSRVIRQTEMQSEGVHSGSIDAVDLNLKPGMYYLKFTLENKVIVKKVVKL